MKYTLFIILCVSFSFPGFTQDKKQPSMVDTAVAMPDQDSIEVNTNHGKRKVKLIFERGKEAVDDHLDDHPIYNKEENEEWVSDAGLFGGITFSRFDLGMAKMLDHGKMELSSDNRFLGYRNWKSVNVGFDVAQVGYRFGDKFRILLAVGFDWTQFRLKNDIIIKEDTSPLEYEDADISFSKNRFGSSYLRIPLTFEFRSKDTFTSRFHFAAGPLAGILMRGNQKFKSAEEGKHKTIDDFNYTAFRYGAFARVGYDWFGLYAKYYFNNIFQNSPNQQDLKNLSFGFMLFF